jgi:protein TonB
VALLPPVPPRPVGADGSCRLDYPEAAKRRGIEGLVVVHVAVSATGAPTGVAVAKSSGHDILDDAALATVRKCRFEPATQGGTPTAGTANLPFRFRLEE